jgi:hypothetical protein
VTLPRGYLTLATGRPAFLEMAVDMVLSLKEHTSLPVGVACDDGLAELARDQYGSVFDQVTTIPERFLGGRTRKFGVAEASPFEETVFLDADCIVLQPIDELFESLDGCDLAFLGSQLTEAEDHNHHGFSTRWLMRKFGLESYLKTNSGVFCFRREPAVEVMEAFRTCHEEEARPRLRGSILLGRWLGDEIAIGIVGGRLGLCSMPFPNTMYWPQEFDSIDLEHPTKPLLHFIWPPSPELFEELLEGMRRRRAGAGVGGSAEEHWRAEARSLEHMKRRRRLLERMGWW